MKKGIYILSLVLLICNISFAQFVGKDGVSKALFYLQKEELDSAKKYIDEASVDSTINNIHFDSRRFVKNNKHLFISFKTFLSAYFPIYV